MKTSQQISTHDPKDLESLLSMFSSMLGIPQITPLTLKQFADKNLQKLKNSSSAAYIRSQQISINYLLNYFGTTVLLSEIKTEQIENLLVKLKNHAPRGYRNYFRNFKVFFNNAVNQNYLRVNPCAQIKLPKQQKEKPKVLSRVDLEMLFIHSRPQVICDIIRFGFNTGCRLGEILNLQWTSINLTEKIITIGSKEFLTKTRKQREIPMGNEVFEQLKKLRPKIVDLSGHYVFRSKRTGKKLTSDYVSKRFKAMVRAAGLSEDFHFHSLRHSFASHLVRSGVNLYRVKELLGHSNITTTEIYAHLDLDSLRKAVAQLEQVQ